MHATLEPRSDLAVFGLQHGRAFAESVAEKLGSSLAPHEEREFDRGEHKTRPLESVRGRDVYVIQSLHGEPEQSVNDKLCRLLFFLGALRDAGAGRLTAVVPYLPYSRKDRKTKSRDPITTRYVAALFEAMQVDRVVTLQVHNVAAFQNAFRCRTEHLESHVLFADALAAKLREREVVVVSPDVGGVKRANGFREVLGRRLGRELPMAFLEKRRSEDVVRGEALMGDVDGRTVVLFDDLVSGATTLARAAGRCQAAGAKTILAAAAHGVFTPAASDTLMKAPIEQLFVLDHVPPIGLDHVVVRDKLTIVEASGLLAEAIRRMHEGGSLVELLEEGPAD